MIHNEFKAAQADKSLGNNEINTALAMLSPDP